MNGRFHSSLGPRAAARYDGVVRNQPQEALAERRPVVTIGKLARLRKLPRSERTILFAAAVGLPLFSVGLRLLGLERFRALLRRSTPAVVVSRDSPPPIRIAELVAVAANHSPWSATCLTRSLLLSWMLDRRGVRSTLRIGVCIVEERLDAHAWVEQDGQALNDTAEKLRAYREGVEPFTLLSGASCRVGASQP